MLWCVHATVEARSQTSSKNCRMQWVKRMFDDSCCRATTQTESTYFTSDEIVSKAENCSSSKSRENTDDLIRQTTPPIHHQLQSDTTDPAFHSDNRSFFMNDWADLSLLVLSQHGQCQSTQLGLYRISAPAGPFSKSGRNLAPAKIPPEQDCFAGFEKSIFPRH